MKKSLITIGIFIAAQLFVSLILVISAMIQGNDFSTIFGPALLISDALVIVLLLAIKYCSVKELVQKVPADVFFISLAFGICGMFAVELLSSGVEIPNMLEEQFKQLAKTTSGFLAVCIIGPVMEEIMMRRVILKEMEKVTKSMWAGILISSAVFAVLHINPIQVVFAMPAGIILGWLYCKTGSLLVPIGLHILNNTISFITLRICPDCELNIKDTLGTVLFIILTLIAILSAIWIVRYYNKLKKEQELAEATATEPVQATAKGTFQGDSYEK